MNLPENGNSHQQIITLLSNGSPAIYNNNTLTSFSNKLQKNIKLDPLLHHYIALQEIGISLNSENIPLPNNNPSLYFFEWNLEIFKAHYFSRFSNISFLNHEVLTNIFLSIFLKKRRRFLKTTPILMV